MNILVSIIIPTYNRAEYLPDAIESVLQQNMDEFEIVIIDDGSTDSTQKLVNRYIDIHGDKKVKYLKQKNQGQAAARNYGVRKACGKYIAFLDSDDIWVAKSLKERIEYLEKNTNISLIFSDMTDYYKEDVSLKSFMESMPHLSEILESKSQIKNAFGLLIEENYINTSTVIMRRDCFLDIGLFDETLRTGEDRDLWLRVAVKYNLSYLPIMVTKRRRNDDNVTRDIFLNHTSRIKVLEKVKKVNPKYYLFHKSRVFKNISENCFSLGYYFFNIHQLKAAFKWFSWSIFYAFNFKAVVYLVVSMSGERAVTIARTIKGHIVL